jgi:hypothetical protein
MIEVISGILYSSEHRRFHMRKSRFTDSQIMAVLKQAEAGVKVPDLCREHCKHRIQKGPLGTLADGANI